MINALLSSSTSRNGNQGTSTPTKKEASRELLFIKASDSEDDSDDRLGHELRPTSPIESPRCLALFLTSPTKPRDSTRSAPRTPSVAGPSTPVRTPRSSSHRKAPYKSPIKRPQAKREPSSQPKAEPQSGRNLIIGPEIIDLTVESEDDVFYNRTPSRKASTRARIPNKSSQIIDMNKGEIVDISD
uniref:Uncharacterized protein n=1 Tax=Psilocybe cubensis TaxID=181762 RepID=A0A8H7XRT0_PSICU